MKMKVIIMIMGIFIVDLIVTSHLYTASNMLSIYML